VLSAELDFRLYSGSAGTTRAALKDDFKILGQAKSYQIAYLITEDERTLYRFCEELRKTGIISTRAIKLADGFSRSHFDPQGQTDIDSQLDESSETAQ
jgi:hypothetical protein